MMAWRVKHYRVERVLPDGAGAVLGPCRGGWRGRALGESCLGSTHPASRHQCTPILESVAEGPHRPCLSGVSSGGPVLGLRIAAHASSGDRSPLAHSCPPIRVDWQVSHLRPPDPIGTITAAWRHADGRESL